MIAEPGTIGAPVARSREQLGPSFAVIFDQALVSAHERLAAEPADRGAKLDFVATYRVLIEATLGLTAFEFITRYVNTNRLLPGFGEGYSHIHHDEQRHIGYGVWFLRQAAAQNGAMAGAGSRKLTELLPAIATALAPPDSEDTDWEALGATGDEVRKYALDGLPPASTSSESRSPARSAPEPRFHLTTRPALEAGGRPTLRRQPV